MPKKDPFEMPYMKGKLEKEKREKEIIETLKTLPEITRKKERGRQEKEFEQTLREKELEAAREDVEQEITDDQIVSVEELPKKRKGPPPLPEEFQESEMQSIETAGEIEIPKVMEDPKKFEKLSREKSMEVAEELKENNQKTIEQEINALQKNKIINFSADSYFSIQAKVNAYEEALAALGDRLANAGYDVNKGRMRRWFQKFNFTRKAEPDQLDNFNEQLKIYGEMKRAYENLDKTYAKMSSEVYDVIGHGNVFAIAVRGAGGSLGGTGIGLKK